MDVYRWRELDALVVDCQADLLLSLPSRFVMPLLPESPNYGLSLLNPRLSFDGDRLTLVPQLAMTLTVAELGKPVGSVIAHEYNVMRSIDFLITGV